MNIHRKGQGYWTRMLTAVGAGLLVLGGVAWLWNTLSGYRWQYMIFLQAGLAVLIIAFFAFLVWKFVAAKPASVDFMVATEDEMKKVNWPSKREVFGSTWVVICCVVMLVAVLLASDYVWAGLMRWWEVIP